MNVILLAAATAAAAAAARLAVPFLLRLAILLLEQARRRIKAKNLPDSAISRGLTHIDKRLTLLRGLLPKSTVSATALAEEDEDASDED